MVFNLEHDLTESAVFVKPSAMLLAESFWGHQQKREFGGENLRGVILRSMTAWAFVCCIHGLPSIHHRSWANRCPEIGRLRTWLLALDQARVASCHRTSNSCTTQVSFIITREDWDHVFCVLSSDGFAFPRVLSTKLMHGVSRFSAAASIEIHSWLYY